MDTVFFASSIAITTFLKLLVASKKFCTRSRATVSRDHLTLYDSRIASRATPRSRFFVGIVVLLFAEHLLHGVERLLRCGYFASTARELVVPCFLHGERAQRVLA